MPYPTTPDIATSYTAFEQSQGDGSFPGQELDVDLASVAASVAAVIQFLQGIARSDGKLANQSVGREQLSTEVLLGFTAPTTWTTGVAYKATNTVFQGTGFYLCNIDHTAGDFASDLTAGRWTLLADINASGALVAGNNLSDLPDAAAARTNLGLGTMAQQNDSSVSVGTLAAGFARVTTPSGSRVDLQASSVADTHERTRLERNATGFVQQTGNAAGNSWVTDYAAPTGPNGVTEHGWSIEGTPRFSFDADSYSFGDPAQARLALGLLAAWGTPAVFEIGALRIEIGSQVTDGAGGRTVTFSAAFASAPRVIVSPNASASVTATFQSQSTTAVFVQTWVSSTGLASANTAFHYIAIGPKA